MIRSRGLCSIQNWHISNYRNSDARLSDKTANAKTKRKEEKKTLGPRIALRGPHVAIELRPASDLHLMHALARDAPEHVGGALGHDGVELRGTLDEEEARKAERVDAEALARRGEHVRVVPPREDVHVPEREQHVVRRRARGVVRRVPHRRDAQLEQIEERSHERGLQLGARGRRRSGRGQRQSPDVVREREAGERERFVCPPRTVNL